MTAIDTYLKDAKELSDNKCFAELLGLMSIAHDEHPRNLYITRHYAYALARAGRNIDALYMFADVVFSGKFSIGDLPIVIQSARKLQDLAVVRKLLLRLISQIPNDRALAELVIEMYCRYYRWEEAIDVIDHYRIKSGQSDDFDVLRAHLENGDIDGIISVFPEQQFPILNLCLLKLNSLFSASDDPAGQAKQNTLIRHRANSDNKARYEHVLRFSGNSARHDILSFQRNNLRSLAHPDEYIAQLKTKFGLGNDTWIFVAHAKTGDHFYFFSLLPAFKRAQRKIGVVDHVTVLVHPRQLNLIKMFSDRIDRIEVLDNCNVAALQDASSQLRPGVPLGANPNLLLRNSAGRYHTILPSPVPKQFCDSLRFALHLNPDAALEPPRISSVSRKEAAAFMRENDMPRERSVILAPAATSMPLLGNDVWQKVADILNGEGYRVFLNVGPEKDRMTLAGVDPISFNHSIAVPLIEACGWAIINRSGLADIVSPARARLTVIYGRPRSEINNPWPFRERWRLNQIDVTGRVLTELECCIDDDPDTLARMIVESGQRS